MRDHHNGDAEAMVDLPQEVENLHGGRRVKGAGRLVAEQHMRLGGEGAGNGDTLLLPAGKLRRIRFFFFGEADHIQQLPCPLNCLRPLNAGNLERIGDIVKRRALREQVEALEDHPDLLPRRQQLAPRERQHGPAVHQHIPLGGHFQQIDTSHQGRLPCTGKPDNAEDVPIVYRQVDVLHCREVTLGAVIGLRQISDFDHSRSFH